MIRVLIYFIVVAALAFGDAWLADRPGEVTITWLGHRIDTSVMVLASAIAAVAFLSAAIWSLLRALARSRHTMGGYLRSRRGARGYHALSRGLVAVASGDIVAARKFIAEASRMAPDEPLTLLLRAQTAQLGGDREGAARSFEQMAARADTQLLGLHGLFIEARRRNDPAAALLYAEEAAKHASVPAWAGRAVLEFRCGAGDWSGALARLERNMESGLVEKAVYRRQRAVLLTAQAIAAEEGDRGRAASLVVEAAKLAPDLVPAAALAGRLLAENGEFRKAARVIEAAWGANPHPDLADAYAHLRSGNSARERLARIEALASRASGNIEAALAIARAALDAQEFVIARKALASLTDAPTRRVAALMAELEQRQHGDEGRAREWMIRALRARRDPAWTADGFVSERWLPVSPVTGRLDAFEWKDPLAGDEPAGALIEAQKSRMEETGMLLAPRGAAAASSPKTEELQPSSMSHGVGAPGPSSDSQTSSAPGREDERERETASARDVSPTNMRGISPGSVNSAPTPVAPALIPLVHAPDDPGPDPAGGDERSLGSVEGAAANNWTRIRQIFRS
jgi:HemY protein